ncbi:MAG: hypothetical protein QM831_09755 [Kofleriaceae bacterium]
MYDAALSPDHTLLGGRTENTLIAWDVFTHVKARLLVPQGVKQVMWVGASMQYLTSDLNVMRWYPFQEKTELLAKLPDIGAFAGFSPDGEYVAFFDITRHLHVVGARTGRSFEIGQSRLFTWDGNTLVRQLTLGHYERVDVVTGSHTTFDASFKQAAIELFIHDHVLYSQQYPSLFVDQNGHELRSGHNAIASATVSLSDGRIASVTGDGSSSFQNQEKDTRDNDITLVDRHSLARLIGHQAPISSLESSDDVLISADIRGQVRVWHSAHDTHIQQPFDVTLAFLDEARRSLIEHEPYHCADVVDVATWKALERIAEDGYRCPPNPERDDREFADETRVFPLRRSRSRWVFRDEVGDLFVWDRSSGHALPLDFKGNDRAFAISSDGRVVVAANDDDLYRWTSTGAIDGPWKANTVATDITLDSGGTTMAYTSPESIFLGHFDGKPDVKIRDVSNPTSLLFTPNDRQLVVAHDTTISVLDLPTFTESRTLTGHTSAVHHVELDELDRIVSVSADHSVRIWHADDSATILKTPSTVDTIDIHGNRAITIEENKTLRLWDLDTETSRILPSTSAVFGGFTADNEIVAVERDGRITRYRDDAPYGEIPLRIWIDALIGPR